MSPVPNKTKVIDPHIHVTVGNDGVWIGFFADSGKVGMVNVEQLARGPNLPARSRAGLSEWVREQRQRAATSANVVER